MQTVKKQKLSELAKSKGVYAFLLVGVFVVVTAVLIAINRQSGQPEIKNPVDLNEEPMNLVENKPDQNATPSKEDVDDHTSSTDTKDNLSSNNEQQEKPSKDPEENALSKNENEETANLEEVTKNEVSDTDQVAQEVKPVIVNTTVESLSFKPETGLIWPLDGNVIMNYSDDRTVYHATLMQFKTNPAILIDGEAGEQVVASAKGIVSSIENHADTGLTVTLDIGDGYQLVYGQMDETKLKVGDVVEEGEVLGVLAKVSKYYSLEGDHLYFQVLNSDTTVNPMLLLRDE